jgi:pSer/pThr/pTyr-binding forkhead associated (FHA) protein
MKARVVVVSGRLSGRMFEIPPGQFVIGRQQDCQLVVDSAAVNRHHCELLMDDYTLRVRDLRSSCGTFVNSEPIRQAERTLNDGDTVQIADLQIRIELES